MGSFDYRIGEEAPIGTVLQSPANLEKTTNGKYLMIDGRVLSRGDYPELASMFPSGDFLSTARTLTQTPNLNAMIASDDTNFLVAGMSASTSPLQASADGITWVTSATWGSVASTCVIRAGSRFVMAGQSSDLAVPWVSTINQTAANQCAKANWTATTGGTTIPTLKQALAYSPQLARTVLIHEGASTNYYTLEDAGTVWTTRTATSATKAAICWSGSKFITVMNVAGNFLQTSTDGITWGDLYIPHYYTVAGGVPSIASDGNGTVAISFYDSTNVTQNFLVSKDHGATWRTIGLPMWANTNYTGAIASGVIAYIDGRFVQSLTTTGWAMSVDGLAWESRTVGRNGISFIDTQAAAYKSGVYCGIKMSSAIALTSVEDAGKFVLPNISPYGNSNTARHQVNEPFPYYIKARSK